MKKVLIFAVILISCFFVFADEITTEDIDVLAQETWKIVLRKLKDDTLSVDKKIKLLEEFVENTPEQNKYHKEAKHFLKNIKISTNRLTDLIDREKYRTGTEWLSLSFVGGNYGVGGSISFFTFRWKYFLWEAIRLQATRLDPMLSSGIFSLNFKTMVGVPIFVKNTYANQHEFRICSGFTGGRSHYQDRDKKYYALESFINIPLEVSYLYHMHSNFTFQIGLTADFPVFFFSASDGSRSGDNYVPLFSGFIGFRI